MKTSLTIGILVLLALSVGAAADMNGFCVSRSTVGAAPPPPNGVNVFQPRPNLGWQLFYNDNPLLLPIPGRPWGGSNLGNLGNVLFSPPVPPMFPLPLLFGDQIDALDTWGDYEDGTDFLFSVDDQSFGIPGVLSDVNKLMGVSPWQVCGSIFQTDHTIPGKNSWCVDALEIGLDPLLSSEELCAYDRNNTPNGVIAFSLDAASPSLWWWPVNYSAADIFTWDFNRGIPGMGISARNLGLFFSDDIDAFTYLDNPPVQNFNFAFSLAPGSPTLAFFGWSPADIILANGWGLLVVPASIGLDAASLGLLPTDNIDALDGVWGSYDFNGTPPASYDQLNWGWDVAFSQMTGDIVTPEPRACYAILLSIVVATVFALRIKSK